MFVRAKRALIVSKLRGIQVSFVHAGFVNAKFIKIVLGIMGNVRPGVIWGEGLRGLRFVWIAGCLNC